MALGDSGGRARRNPTAQETVRRNTQRERANVDSVEYETPSSMFPETVKERYWVLGLSMAVLWIVTLTLVGALYGGAALLLAVLGGVCVAISMICLEAGSEDPFSRPEPRPRADRPPR